MSTFSRVNTARLAMALLLGAAAGCGASSGDCLRYSDCDPGLTCAFGHCVAPPSQYSADAAASDEIETAATIPESGATPIEASVDDANLPVADAPAE